MTRRPPPVAVWLLTRRLPARWRDFVIGDLEEEFAGRAASSAFVARVWFWWQALRCLLAPPPVRRDSALLGSRGASMMRLIVSDLRHGWRSVRRTPSFAAAVVSVLALGIGANTALFSIVNAALLRPLPFAEPDRLVRFFTRTPAGMPFDVSPGKFSGWQRQAQSFEEMAVYACCGFRDFALTGTGTARTVRATPVSAGFFEVVGATPAIGRTFRAADDTPGGEDVVVLSERFWRSQFGGDQDVIGRPLQLSGRSYTVVGVMPARASVGAWSPMESDLWMPLALTEEQRTRRQNHNLEGVARLKRGVSLRQAQAEMNAIAAEDARTYGTDPRWGAAVLPLQDTIVADSRPMLLMLMGAVGFVLLIACANVGNLLFTRALNLRRETAIRAALGAGRRRVLQQVLSEALLLAGIGGVVGLGLAHLALGQVTAWLAVHVPRAREIAVDGRVLCFAVVVSMLAGVLAGTLPAVRAGRTDLSVLLRSGGRSHSAAGLRTRRVLIVCEVALSVVLLVGAGVMVRSLLALRHVEAGFDPHDVLTMHVTLIESRYPTAAHRSAFFDEAMRRVQALPGVEAAGTVDDLPFLGGEAQPVARAGATGNPDTDSPVVQVRRITPGYLEAMRIPVLRGRDIAESDRDVLLMSVTAAKMVWGADDPLGRQARLPLMSDTIQREVIGVVGDVRQRTLSEPLTPTVYYYSRERSWDEATVVVRTSMPPDAMSRSIVAAIQSVDAEQPVEDIRTMRQVIDSRLTPQRFSALLLGAFAGMALLLASIGIYAVLSYIVRGRSREIAIRAALGARTADVLRLVLVEAMSPTLVGIVLGVCLAVVSGRALERLIYGVRPADPLTVSVVCVMLVFAAVTASVLPAFRASRLDPAEVLRAE